MAQGSKRGWAGLMTAGAAGAAMALALIALAHAEIARHSALAEPMPVRVEWPVSIPQAAFQKSAVPRRVALAPSSSRLTSKTRRVVVSIPDRKLALVADGRVVKIYRVAVGARVSPSPTGKFQIVTRIPEATYYHESVVIAAGEQSPIGTRWIGLNVPGYGIHGTNAPGSIGKAASHGCIRMRNRDAEEFFEMVQVGDAVEIRRERDEEVAELFGAVRESSEAAAHGAGMGGSR